MSFRADAGVVSGRQTGWPAVVAKEVSESVQNFIGHIQIARGE
jgi:hypothetical protein